jgi:hypothetical protein
MNHRSCRPASTRPASTRPASTRPQSPSAIPPSTYLFCRDVALDVLISCASSPPIPQTIALLADHRLRAHTALCIDGAAEPEQVVHVAELIMTAATPRQPGATRTLDAFVLATFRPEVDGFTTEADEHTWFELRCRADDGGLDLLDWFVITADTVTALCEFTDSHSLWLD